jgi:hypothetical protein
LQTRRPGATIVGVRPSTRRIGVATALTAAVLAGAIVFVRPALALVVIGGATAGLLIGAVAGIVRARAPLRRVAPAAVLVPIVLAAAAATSLLAGAGPDRGASPSTEPPIARRVLSHATYAATLRLDSGPSRWRVAEHFVIGSATLGRSRDARLRAARRLARRATTWRAIWTGAGDLRLDRTRTAPARIDSLPSFLTANRLPLPKLQWSPRTGVIQTVTAAEGSALALRTPRRMIHNSDPEGRPRDVTGGEQVTRLVLASDAEPFAESAVEFDLANRWGRTALYARLRSASLWGGIGWLLGGLVSAFAGALAASLVPRYLERRLPAAAETHAHA